MHKYSCIRDVERAREENLECCYDDVACFSGNFLADDAFLVSLHAPSCEYAAFVSVLLLARARACWSYDDVYGCSAVNVLLIGLVNVHLVYAELEMLVTGCQNCSLITCQLKLFDQVNA